MQDFFLRRLVAQRGASARTVEAYRDAFELLLGFAEQRTGKPPSALALPDLDAPLVLDFLDHLETERGNSARTRNARLAAIHSFMRYAALRDPTGLPITARVLAIPAKRFDRPVLGYLSREQIAAILAAPDRTTWSGRRDAVLLATAYNTGARVSELTHLQVRDVLLDRQCAVHLHGKGRKQRAIPLWNNTADELRGWLSQIISAPPAPVFPNRAGAPLTRSGVRVRLDRPPPSWSTTSRTRWPSLSRRHRNAATVSDAELTDRMLIFGEHHLRRVLAAYSAHYNARGRTSAPSCPHHARDARPRSRAWKDPATTSSRRPDQRVRTRRLKPQITGLGRVLEPDRADRMGEDGTCRDLPTADSQPGNPAHQHEPSGETAAARLCPGGTSSARPQSARPAHHTGAAHAARLSFAVGRAPITSRAARTRRGHRSRTAR